MKRLFLPILVTLSMFTVSCDKDSVTNPDDVPVSVTESELKEAFYYTFPLMIMDATESVETNTETFVPGIPRAPVNQLIHAVKLADASNKSVVTPNVDTYYSRLWMDMNEEPVVFEFPDVKDRFCNIQVDVYKRQAVRWRVLYRKTIGAGTRIRLGFPNARPVVSDELARSSAGQ